MNKRHRKAKRQQSERDSAPSSSSGRTDRRTTRSVPAVGSNDSATFGATSSARQLRAVGLAFVSAILVFTQLCPCDSSSTQQGHGVMLVLLWLTLAAGGCVYAALRCWTNPGETSRQTRSSAANIAAALFLALLVASAAYASRDNNMRLLLNATWQWISLVVSYFVLRRLASGAAEQRAIVSVMLALAVGLSAMGAYQYFYSAPRDRARFRENPDQVLREAGIFAPPGSPLRKHFADRLESTEPMGPFALTNSLAAYLSTWLIVALSLGANAALGGRGGSADEMHGKRSADGKSRGDDDAHSSSGSRVDREFFAPGIKVADMWRIGALIAIWLFAAGILVLTKSRTAYLAAAFGAALVAADSVLRRNRFGWKLPLIAVMLPLVLVAVLVAVGVLVGGVDRLVLSESLKSFSYRIEYWRAAAAMIADHPLAGVGPGSFQSHYAAYKLPQASEMVLDPHNFALEIAASSGLPALVAFALLLVVKLGRTLVSRRLERDSEESDAAAIHSDMQDTEMLNSRIAGRSAMIGAAIGLLLAMPMAMLVRYPYDANGVMVAIVGVAVTLALLRRETFSLHLPTAVPLIGATVLLVNLLAASGIGSPGVAQSLWLLLAFVSGEGRGTSDRTTTNDGPEKRPALLRFVATAALAMLSITAWGAFLWLMYWPVMQGGVLFEEANVLLLQGSVGPAVQRYREAARVDPYSADPWQQIASLQHRRWVMFLANEADDARNDEARPAAVADQRADTTRHDGATESADERHRLEAEFRESADEMLRRLPHAHHAWRLYGVWLLAAYQQAASHPAPSDDWRADTERYGHDAEAAFVRAVEHYPNHNYGHAELAWVRRKLGDNAGAASAAETALRLDALVPHSELQLKNRPFESDLAPDVPTTDVESLLREWLGANDSAR